MGRLVSHLRLERKPQGLIRGLFWISPANGAVRGCMRALFCLPFVCALFSRFKLMGFNGVSIELLSTFSRHQSLARYLGPIVRFKLSQLFPPSNQPTAGPRKSRSSRIKLHHGSIIARKHITTNGWAPFEPQASRAGARFRAHAPREAHAEAPSLSARRRYCCSLQIVELNQSGRSQS